MKSSVTKKVSNFLFRPASARPIAVLRILLSGILIVQAFLLSHDLLEMYSRGGLLQGALGDYMAQLALPNLDWLQREASVFGIQAESVTRIMFAVYLGSLCTLFLGWHTRASSVIAWLSHFVLIESGFNFNYGVDHFANIFLFYLMWMPAGHALSMDASAGRATDVPSSGARLSLRVLQFELSVVYFSSGIHKALGQQWWNGEAVWRSVSLPMFGVMKMSWLAFFPWLAVLLCWGTLLIEIGYPFFMYNDRTRKLAILATISLHLGIALGIGLISFSATMAALTFSAFWISPEPRTQLSLIDIQQQLIPAS